MRRLDVDIIGRNIWFIIKTIKKILCELTGSSISKSTQINKRLQYPTHSEREREIEKTQRR